LLRPSLDLSMFFFVVVKGSFVVFVLLSLAAGGAKPKVVAPCSDGGVELTAEAKTWKRQGRGILIIVQTVTKSKSNVCLGARSDWREGLGQCLARMTGLRTIVQNDDGSCADCATLEERDCNESDFDHPPGLVIVVGGGEDPQKTMRFRCTGSYCRTRGGPFVVGTGHFPPHDYKGACDAYPLDKRGRGVFEMLDLSVEPRPRVIWLPILNPQSEIRALFEKSTLYATHKSLPLRAPDETDLPARRPREWPERPGDAADSDFHYLKSKVEPLMDARPLERVRIDLLRDDAFAKPLLLPKAERDVYDRDAALLSRGAREQREEKKRSSSRAPRLVYVGIYRRTKGQLDFLRKLDPRSLGKFALEFYGTRPRPTKNTTSSFKPSSSKLPVVVDDDWDAIKETIAANPGLAAKVVAYEERIPHVAMVAKLATASGLIHCASSDRNPRVLYEALYFGLPLFVTVQSMPYVGLQCQPFVVLTDFDAPPRTLNAQLRAWTDKLAATTTPRDDVTETTTTTTTTPRQDDDKTTKLRASIRTYVEAHLTPERVYLALCQRFGLCERRDLADARTPWAPTANHPCARRHLWRYDNWVAAKWNVSKLLKRSLNITSDHHCRKPLRDTSRNCQSQCLAMNAKDDLLHDDHRPWWLPSFVAKPARKRYTHLCGRDC